MTKKQMMELKRERKLEEDKLRKERRMAELKKNFEKKINLGLSKS